MGTSKSGKNKGPVGPLQYQVGNPPSEKIPSCIPTGNRRIIITGCKSKSISMGRRLYREGLVLKCFHGCYIIGELHTQKAFIHEQFQDIGQTPHLRWGLFSGLAFPWSILVWWPFHLQLFSKGFYFCSTNSGRIRPESHDHPL